MLHIRSYPLDIPWYPLIFFLLHHYLKWADMSGYGADMSGYLILFSFLKRVSIKTKKYQQLPSIVKIWSIQSLEKRVFFPMNELYNTASLHWLLKPNSELWEISAHFWADMNGYIRSFNKGLSGYRIFMTGYIRSLHQGIWNGYHKMYIVMIWDCIIVTHINV